MTDSQQDPNVQLMGNPAVDVRLFFIYIFPLSCLCWACRLWCDAVDVALTLSCPPKIGKCWHLKTDGKTPPKYSWIGHGLQGGPTLAFLWLPDFKTKTSSGFLIKKIRGVF